MWFSILSWLIGSKAGRITAVTLLSLVMIGVITWQAFRRGAASERAKQAVNSLDNLRKRVAINDQVSRMDGNARRAELQRWVQPDNR